jgi:uncharacterized protein (DUF433 family)
MQQPLAEPIPLQRWEDGTFRVGGTRVTLDTVVAAFHTGATPEEIAQDYSSLNLSDIYAVIAYYLRHREEVEQYLREREGLTERVRQESSKFHGAADLRSRLMARQSA